MSAESSNLSNIEHRAVIKYFVKKGKTPKEIFEDMVSVLQESAPSYTMVKNGLAYFNKDESCEDDPRPGRPVTIAEELQISKERVGEIIRAYEYEKNQCALGTKMLTPFDKQRRLQTRVHAMDEKGERPPKKFKVQKSASKLMATIFGIVKVHESSRTEATWEVIARSAVLQDNASVHTARVSRQALKDTGFSEIDHPPTAQI
ncbi:hypothetical protein EVAR_36502_1 [Eumeta japonica]|uniref:Mos1 transposase HTH domain-containing protein n=1 Tax=Eumeta variegata TaxID=151549 RepID=A0A4C1WS15_EUMVA|nr:hypothetical protein EVAR_36502_1 [Eumeta japonica]